MRSCLRSHASELREASPRELRELRWGDVRVRELKRAVVAGGVFPEKDDSFKWLLELTNVVVGRDERGEHIELTPEPGPGNIYALVPSSLGVIRLGGVVECHDARLKELGERAALLPKKFVKILSEGETRQMSHRKQGRRYGEDAHKNPLFDHCEEKARRAKLARALGDDALAAAADFNDAEAALTEKTFGRAASTALCACSSSDSECCRGLPSMGGSGLSDPPLTDALSAQAPVAQLAGEDGAPVLVTAELALKRAQALADEVLRDAPLSAAAAAASEPPSCPCAAAGVGCVDDCSCGVTVCLNRGCGACTSSSYNKATYVAFVGAVKDALEKKRALEPEPKSWWFEPLSLDADPAHPPATSVEAVHVALRTAWNEKQLAKAKKRALMLEKSSSGGAKRKRK